ncbi:hypothetical protein Ctha_2156 [Chloroherpeton thalassium ATCC 35110]|uniref:Capsule assembly protein Wzi n=1 Tax=Chloroherpeton thalassium (strain ATCC 35110 / GB-78) TaxID=517418 RepID=B3QVK7_CHLT3|nr:capsule assembly Wzi family protein [Chloroherpeton thalassium]ACF14607.1 hypothetical protein Ctha_2156 [Chloroherpeton thalassium ATCC 35110]
MILPYKVFANGDTFPANHWAYNIIEQLISRGYLLDINDATKPYERFAIAKSLIEIDKSRIEEKTTYWLIQKLEDELNYEVSTLRDGVYPVADLRIGTQINEIGKNEIDDFSLKLKSSVQTSLYYGENISVNIRNIIQEKNAYDFVVGNRVYAYQNAYTEQAFLAYVNKIIKIKVGRDYISWGYAKNSFNISNTAGSFDQLSFQLITPVIRFSYFTVILDKKLLDSTDNEDDVLDYVNRYYSASRIDLNLFSGNVKIGVWQSVIYGGKQRSLDFDYANPIMVYYAVQWNDRKRGDGNILAGSDMSVNLAKGVNIYAGFVIDDWQIKNVGSQGEEIPNKWGGYFGGKFANVLKHHGIEGTDIFFELVKVNNRTFSHKNWHERLLYGDNPIAHPLGTDFETFSLKVQHWINSSVRLSLDYDVIAKGEGTVQEHTTPWLEKDADGNYIYANGYSESSPYGIVEKTHSLGISLFYQPATTLHLDVGLTHNWIRNVDHQDGKNNTFLEAYLSAWFEIKPVFSLF